MRGLERSLERVALDSSVLIEIVAGSHSVKRLVEDIARGLIEAYTSSLNMVEVLYITCRMWGKEEALRRFSKLLESRMIAVVDLESLLFEIVECKCKIPLSLGDCATLALAKKHRLTPLFLRMEKDLRTAGGRIREWLDLELGFVLGG